MTDTTPTPDRQWILTDPDGNPVGVLDLDAAERQALRLVLELVQEPDADQFLTIAARHQAGIGPHAFAYVTGLALRVMAQHVVRPALAACDVAGLSTRQRLVAALTQAAETTP